MKRRQSQDTLSAAAKRRRKTDHVLEGNLIVLVELWQGHVLPLLRSTWSLQPLRATLRRVSYQHYASDVSYKTPTRIIGCYMSQLRGSPFGRDVARVCQSLAYCGWSALHNTFKKTAIRKPGGALVFRTHNMLRLVEPIDRTGSGWCALELDWSSAGHLTLRFQTMIRSYGWDGDPPRLPFDDANMSWLRALVQTMDPLTKSLSLPAVRVLWRARFGNELPDPTRR